MTTKDIDDIFNWKISLRDRLLSHWVSLKKKLLLWYKWPFKWLKNIEWLVEYDISMESFDSKHKKRWLSAFGRLRNWGEFLEITIESHVDLCDEIILVDNNSDDNTREICQKMQAKYPEKIKIYQYTPEVYKLWSQEYEKVSEKSVHCMSYYYNRALSKTSYSHCIKIDDDHIVIPDRFVNIKERAFKYKYTFFHTPLLNIIEYNKEYFVSSKAPFSWLYGDFGIFPISLKTYFIKDKKMENFLHPYKSIITKVCFFHLKFLKKDKWSLNYVGSLKKYILHQINNAVFISLSNTIKEEFLSLYDLND